MYSRILLIATALAIPSMAPATAYADDHENSMYIAVIDDVPSTTMAVRFLEVAYQRLGLEMKTLVAPSRRALMMADNGKLDGDLFRIDSVAAEYPNLTQVDYPLLEGGLFAVVRDPAAQTMPEPDEKPLQVAVRRDVIIAEQTAETLGMEPLHTESYEQMRQLLERGRVELALVSDIEGLSPLTSDRWSQFTVLPEPVIRFKLYHYVNCRHGNLAWELARVLEELEHEGVKDDIRKRTREEQVDGDW